MELGLGRWLNLRRYTYSISSYGHILKKEQNVCLPTYLITYTEGSCLMRISLVQISLLQFFKPFHEYLSNVNFEEENKFSFLQENFN